MRSALVILTRSPGFIVAASISLAIVTSSRFIISISITTCSTTLNFVLYSFCCVSDLFK